MTVEELIKSGTDILGRERKLEVEVLLASVLHKDRVYLHIHPEEIVSLDNVKIYREGVEKLKENYPFHYLLGKKEWMGYDFKVTEGVLIPREDTRILLEGILSLKGEVKGPLMEVGTGSGILPALIKKEWPEMEIYTVEREAIPYEISGENFRELGVDIERYQGDFLTPLINEGVKGDVLFSNPPYIEGKVFKDLEEEVKKEPEAALVGGEDGLSYYRRFREEYDQVLVPGGYLLLEIGWDQKEAVKKVMEGSDLNYIKCLKDDGDRDRVLVFKRKKGLL